YAIRVSAINELRSVPNMPVSLDATIGKLHAFELSNFDNSGSLVNKVESAFSSFHLDESEYYNDRKYKYFEGDHSGASERFCKNMEEVPKLYEEIRKQEEFEALLAKRLPRGKGKYKGKLPLKCFNCDKIGHMASNCPDKDLTEKRDY
ncbi:zinc finger CCHC domain-containing protein, partial [Klebsiella pneumoniae]